MNRALIVTEIAGAQDFFITMLHMDGCEDITSVSSQNEARRLADERGYDIVIIDLPLQSDHGSGLAEDLAENVECQVIIAVNNADYEATAERMENTGVITQAKPITAVNFWYLLRLVAAVEHRIGHYENEQRDLLKKIDDLKKINRAKLVLIGKLGMEESEAHHYIEKQAMDKRISKREAADEILRKYK